MDFLLKTYAALKANAALQRWVEILDRPVRIVLTLGVLGLIAYKLNQLGWGNIWRNLPTAPLFYSIFVLNYLSLPIFELLIYRFLWRVPWTSLPVFLRKRIYNEAVVEYAGEALFYRWATRECGVPEKKAFRDVRDVNILSGLSGNLVTLAILTIVLTYSTGLLRTSDVALLRNGAILIALLVAGLVALAAIFRGRLISASPAVCAGITGLHVARLLAFVGLQAVQWHAVIPSIGLQQWGLFLALQLGIARIPFLPTKDLVFTGVAISLGAQLAQGPAVAGMFMVGGAMNLLTHLGVYFAGLFQKKAVPR